MPKQQMIIFRDSICELSPRAITYIGIDLKGIVNNSDDANLSEKFWRISIHSLDFVRKNIFRGHN